MKTPTFFFSPRWKEVLICSCDLSSFALEMTMGIAAVYLPTEPAWRQRASDWAQPYWATVHAQLTAWCATEKIPLYLTDDAPLW